MLQLAPSHRENGSQKPQRAGEPSNANPIKVALRRLFAFVFRLFFVLCACQRDLLAAQIFLPNCNQMAFLPPTKMREKSESQSFAV